MNRTKIEWADYTWNPVTGCLHNCEYCYARDMTHRFSGDVRFNMSDARCRKIKDNLYVLDEPFLASDGKQLVYPLGFIPTLHKYRFTKPATLKTGANIFVCSMADLFGSWVPDEWIELVFDTCKANSNHNYLFLTKNPTRYQYLAAAEKLPKGKNMWYGYSLTKTTDSVYYRDLDYNSFVSIEPLLEDVGKLINYKFPIAHWVIIGAETGNRKSKVIPKKEWVDNILAHCDRFKIPVFMKDSLIDIVGEENMRREFPEVLQTVRLSAKRKEVLETHCAKCHKVNRKADMTAIIKRKGRRGNAETIGYICDDCIPEFMKGFDLNENVGGGSP